ncbi:MAG: hypothetical protein BGO05_11870 [Rhizobiales bacterium 63-7]|nr:MAG: hypothetical protein BGO05_11870 [Rhizobiales bacterium 63-7]
MDRMFHYASHNKSAQKMTNDHPFKITVCFEERPGGGLRVWSEDIPGLVLSSSSVDRVLEDVKAALEAIISHDLKEPIVVEPLEDIRRALAREGVIDERPIVPGPKEYVAYRH